MDFNESLMKKQGYGDYVELDPKLLPPLYIAYRTELAEVSGVFHSGLKHRFIDRDADVLSAIQAWIGMTDAIRQGLESGEKEELGNIMNSNFDKRTALGGVNDGNLELVRIARSVGASAKLTGSGGAIIGVYSGDEMLVRLKKACEPLNINVLIPEIADSIGEGVL